MNPSQASIPGHFEIPELGRALRVVQLYALLNLIPASRLVPKVWAGLLLAGFGLFIVEVRSYWRAASQCLWLWAALIITGLPILLGAVFEHGPTATEYAYRFGRAVPFVFFGLAVGWAPDGLRRFAPWLGIGALVAAGVGAVFDIRIQAETGTPGGRYMHGQTDDNLALLTVGWAQAAAFVYVGILLLLCLVATPKRTRARGILVLALLAIVVAVASASFTAATGLLGVIGLFVLGHELIVRRKIAQAVLIGLVVVGSGYLLAASSDEYSERTIGRITALTETAVAGESLEGVDESGRWTAATVSWDTFLSNPMFGVGAYYMKEFNDLIGSHCSILDWLAQYGLVGLIGPAMLFGIALMSSIRMGFREFRPIAARLLALFWIVYLCNGIINPNWLEPAIDFYAFFALGLTAALRHQHQRSGVFVRSSPTPSQPSTVTRLAAASLTQVI